MKVVQHVRYASVREDLRNPLAQPGVVVDNLDRGACTAAGWFASIVEHISTPPETFRPTHISLRIFRRCFPRPQSRPTNKAHTLNIMHLATHDCVDTYNGEPRPTWLPSDALPLRSSRQTVPRIVEYRSDATGSRRRRQVVKVALGGMHGEHTNDQRVEDAVDRISAC